MSSENSANSSDNENTCVVCFKNVDIYSIGICDHPVCFECSTRMRVLCKQNECPMCRQDMPKVILTKEVEPFSVLRKKTEHSNLQDRKFGIYFVSPSIQRAYFKLLDHTCSRCSDKKTFRTFHHLKDHMRREHELFYCDLCVDNLKIFSFERRCYTRQELAMHRRKGDVDNTSHRGHPLCEFCDMRYMDSDELFRHLRREHFYCHFCDADGKHEFYNSYDDLRNHFLEEHYLCEEGDCKNEKFTSAFRTDIDLKAHIASIHSRNLSKAATRQARTLELEFTLAPRNTRTDKNRRRNNERQDDLEGAVGYSNHYMEPGGAPGGRETHSAQERTFVNSLNSENFPSLGNSTTSTNFSRPSSSVTFTKVSAKPFRGEDFPSLGGNSTSNKSQGTSKGYPPLGESNSYRAPEVTITRSLKGQKGLVRNAHNFPALGESSTPINPGTSTLRFSVNNNSQECQPYQNVPNVSIQVKHKPNGAITTSIRASSASSNQSYQPKSMEAFPALNKNSQVPEAQWVPLKPKKPETKPNKVAPPPILPPSDLQADFPSLSSKKTEKKAAKKTSSVTVPVNNVRNESGDGLSEKKAKESKNNVKNNKHSEAKVGTSKSASNGNVAAENGENKSKNKKKKSKTTNGNEKTSSASIIDNNNSESQTNNVESNLTNGTVKKRSELKINTLKNDESDPVVKTDDFPALGAKNPPPGFGVKPPPGFNNFSVSKSNAINTNHVVSSNDLTFTNSTGRSYSIRPITNYHQPEKFAQRNRDLIERFMSILNNNEVFREFKQYSDLFRSGTLPADKFYNHCKSLLGNSFAEVFPELLVLLPDIVKQQELYKVHVREDNAKNLVVCSACQQVVFKDELKAHNTFHNMNEEFPALGNSPRK